MVTFCVLVGITDCANRVESDMKICELPCATNQMPTISYCWEKNECHMGRYEQECHMQDVWNHPPTLLVAESLSLNPAPGFRHRTPRKMWSGQKQEDCWNSGKHSLRKPGMKGKRTGQVTVVPNMQRKRKEIVFQMQRINKEDSWVTKGEFRLDVMQML